MSPTVSPPSASAGTRTRWLGLALTAAVFGVGLWWAKWAPYSGKVQGLSASHTWSARAIFDKAGDTPSLHGAIAFTKAYFQAVWKAAAVAVVLAAALEAFMPRTLVLRWLNRRSSWGQGAAAGLLAMPSMMCSCCTAPVALGLRRQGVLPGAAAAYWLANPLLNPAVLVFLALVLPWQFTFTRLMVGVIVVLGAAFLAQRLTPVDRHAPIEIPSGSVAPAGVAEMAFRFVQSLARYLLVVLPEYVAAVLVMGFAAGWLGHLDGWAGHAGLAVLLLVAAIAVALVIPTAGEIPVILAALAAGGGLGLAGVLLIALPAISVPSMIMVGRAFSWRTMGALAAWVMVGGLLAAGVLAGLG